LGREGKEKGKIIWDLESFSRRVWDLAKADSIGVKFLRSFIKAFS